MTIGRYDVSTADLHFGGGVHQGCDGFLDFPVSDEFFHGGCSITNQVTRHHVCRYMLLPAVADSVIRPRDSGLFCTSSYQVFCIQVGDDGSGVPRARHLVGILYSVYKGLNVLVLRETYRRGWLHQITKPLG
jgi:hypothetical protein